MKRIALIAAVAAFLGAGAARAECSYPPFEFFPEKGGAVTVNMTAVAGTPCTHNFKEGPGYRFTAVERLPVGAEHGRMKKLGRAHYVYTPQAGYSGSDAYMFRICATKGKAWGCTSIAFLVDVKAR